MSRWECCINCMGGKKRSASVSEVKQDALCSPVQMPPKLCGLRARKRHVYVQWVGSGVDVCPREFVWTSRILYCQHIEAEKKTDWRQILDVTLHWNMALRKTLQAGKAKKSLRYTRLINVEKQVYTTFIGCPVRDSWKEWSEEKSKKKTKMIWCLQMVQYETPESRKARKKPRRNITWLDALKWPCTKLLIAEKREKKREETFRWSCTRLIKVKKWEEKQREIEKIRCPQMTINEKRVRRSREKCKKKITWILYAFRMPWTQFVNVEKKREYWMGSKMILCLQNAQCETRKSREARRKTRTN